VRRRRTATKEFERKASGIAPINAAVSMLSVYFVSSYQSGMRTLN
jgi:hypothetical protein